jgi:hypothetical protein
MVTHALTADTVEGVEQARRLAIELAPLPAPTRCR